MGDDISPDRLKGLHALLRCPACRGPLRPGDADYTCTSCDRTYPVVDGIPVFADLTAIQHDEVDHLCGHAEVHGEVEDLGHKAAQSAWFDRAAMTEFEIDRPTGAPALYRWLLGEKFRRSIEPLGGRLDGWTALTVCGGSGMDAQFLAESGASVVSSDISMGAADRVRQRASRHRVPLVPVVADVERLPFADRSVDLVYVHDGLHHLEDPFAGLAEMARVARKAICVTEPASAALTAIAVRLGLALDREEAGNRVARLDLESVSSVLRSSGFQIAQSQRYAMYYRHVPGGLMSLLSRGPLLRLTVLGWRALNAIIGRYGNKLNVVAIR